MPSVVMVGGRPQLVEPNPAMPRIAGWTGILMRSVDGRPGIGLLDGHDGLVGLVGDSGTSFKTAPAIGRALSQLVLEGRSDIDLPPFHAARSENGERRVDEHQYQTEASISR